MNWASYAESLEKYRSGQIQKREATIEDDAAFVYWFRLNEESLRRTPITSVTGKEDKEALRRKYNVVAGVLLPLFENEPSAWEAMTRFNRSGTQPNDSLAKQLSDWRAACEPHHEGFFSKLFALFHVSLL
jgi:hypothetical protein